MEQIKAMEEQFVERKTRRNWRRREGKRLIIGNCNEKFEDQGCCRDKWVCTAGAETKKMSISFQVAAVSKPLLA
eukprot:7305868-Karenia_brevis.AAC.1